MALKIARDKYHGLLENLGRGALHSMFPDDFEYYAVSFELVDGLGEVVDMLVFPVMPSELDVGRKSNASVKKASSSVVSLYNPSFTPFPINMNGTFGRKMRVMMGGTIIAAAVKLGERVFKGKKSKFKSIFNVKIKTGYGVAKSLESMIDASKDIDSEGRPYKLFFYNMAFNSNYLVEVHSHIYSQSEGRNNMYWNYNISMTAIAPAEQVRQLRKSSLIKIVVIGAINKFATKVLDNLKDKLDDVDLKIWDKEMSKVSNLFKTKKIRGRS